MRTKKQVALINIKKIKEVANFAVVVFLGVALMLLYIEYTKLLEKYNQKVMEKITTVETPTDSDFLTAQQAEAIIIDYASENKKLREELVEVKRIANEYVGKWIITEIIKIEGTESNHPADPGGYTRFGISSKIHGFVPKTYSALTL